MIENELVEFENNSKVLEYKYTYKNIPIWPYIRDLLIRRACLDKYGITSINHHKIRNDKYRHYIKYNPFNLGKKDILFFTQSNLMAEENGQIFDRLIDDFIKLDVNNSAKIINCTDNLDFRKLSETSITFSTNTFLQQIIKHEGERLRISNIEINIIEDFIDYIKHNIPFYVEEGVYGAIREVAIKTIKEFPACYKYYSKLVDIIQPKIIICHCGIYGLPQVRVFNDCGVITAEYQHASIYFHFDYMYGKKIAENTEYKKCVPKYLLTWGDYWTCNKNLPTNIFKIGNPTVQKNIDKFNNMKLDIDDSFNILILVGDRHEWCIKFIYYILENLPSDFRIILKLHPLQPYTAKYYEPFYMNERVSIVSKGFVYKYFAMCKYIVGDTSTSVYEAAAVGKKVFIIDNEYTRGYLSNNFGIWIKNGQEFIEKMDKNINNQLSKKDFFEDSWEQNYLRFLQKVVY